MTLKRSVATLFVLAVYEGTRAVARVSKSRRSGPISRILLIGTFHNPNWFHSHVTPLTKVAHVFLVCDAPVEHLENLTYLCPPRWLSAAISRAGAKLVMACAAAIRVRPDLCMGYHIVPAAVIARIAAALAGCRSAYQATGGWIQVEGGGWASDTPVLSLLGGPSRIVERSACRLVSTFDLVVVRGSKAKREFEARTQPGQIDAITGSVDSPAGSSVDRDIDIIYVGRLEPVKRLHLIVETTALLHQAGVNVRVVLVGAGSEETRLKDLAASLGVAAHIEFVGRTSSVLAYFRRSKIFMLTSRSEGLSIALIEAMSQGCVPVVANVGDLADAVEDGSTGILVDSGGAREFTLHCERLLADDVERTRLAARACEQARTRYTVDAVSGLWTSALTRLSANLPR